MRVGTDIISVARVKRMLGRYGAAFQNRYFSEDERSYCGEKAHPARHFAGKLAAKEAVAKVLRIRWNEGFSWRDIRIPNGPDGAPTVELRAVPERFAREHGLLPGNFDISVSHCDEYATATAIWWPCVQPAEG